MNGDIFSEKFPRAQPQESVSACHRVCCSLFSSSFTVQALSQSNLHPVHLSLSAENPDIQIQQQDSNLKVKQTGGSLQSLEGRACCYFLFCLCFKHFLYFHLKTKNAKGKVLVHLPPYMFSFSSQKPPKKY